MTNQQTETADAYRAQLVSNQPDAPGWRLFVVLPGLASNWPEATWSTSNPPTVHQRTTALDGMGYRYATPDRAPKWDWSETQPWEDNPRALVELTAVTHVRPLED
ncbi:DUF6303 family protein [Streptomyces sp. NRRL B-24484]|uniref:DUF6303 family protein n=1 Tax=Streptomyces sp. NRRL B-24484 TaxID=1463833 RepID=UPI00069487F2|nr:DUF6303 family protein [Streptomyces sp. NRRL B-24484]